VFKHFERRQIVKTFFCQLPELINDLNAVTSVRQPFSHQVTAVTTQIMTGAMKAAIKKEAGHVTGTSAHFHQASGRPGPAHVKDRAFAEHQFRLFLHLGILNIALIDASAMHCR
jgi:hypothetical protein